MAEAEIELQANTGEEREPRLYELGYHLLSVVAEESVSEEVGTLKDLIEKHKGVVASDQMPRATNLAYSMSKIINGKRKYFDTALFGWIKFHMPPASALELKEELKHNKSILRSILIRTMQEKDSTAKKMTFLKPKYAVSSQTIVEKKKKPEKALSEAELDKTIEELVAE